MVKPVLTVHDLDIAARTVYGEARGEPASGRLAVAHVLMNRWASKKWFGASTLAGVCLMPFQFSCWNQDDPNLPSLKSLDYTRPILRDCLRDTLFAYECKDMYDPTGGATHYYAFGKIAKPKWVATGIETTQIGGHAFYAGID